MTRRGFLWASMAAAAASALPAGAFAQQRRIERIGLQLYSVRDLMKESVAGTLAKVGAIGFKEVEFAGYFERSPKEIRAILDKSGLTAPSAHVDIATIEKRWPETLEGARVMGHQFLICPWVGEEERKQPDIWKRLADLFNRAGKTSLESGIQFAYHQHSFEFVPSAALGGKTPYDFLLENTDPMLVKMELDLCWIAAADRDPLAYFDRYPGRFPLVHVKDWLDDGKQYKENAGALGPETKFTGRMENVGSGSIDWKRIFAQAGKAGIKHYIVEHDNPKSPFDDLRASYTYLRDLRF